MSTQKTYRNRTTGLIGPSHPSVALAFPELEEVGEGTKPLAFTPIPADAIEAAVGAPAAGSDDESPTQGKAPDLDPATPRKLARKAK